MKPVFALFCLCLAIGGDASAEGLSPAMRIMVEKTAGNVLTALAKRDFKTLSAFAAGDGLIVSPYVTLDKGDVRLSRSAIEHCASDPKVRLWGHRDGSGDPIKMTCKSYFREFVWNTDYRKADEVLYNEPRQRGNDYNNNHRYFPGGIVVEYHFRESPEDIVRHVPWTGLRLIFYKEKDKLLLIAITRDVWTI